MDDCNDGVTPSDFQSLLEDVFGLDLDRPTCVIKEGPILSELPLLQLPTATLQEDSDATKKGCCRRQRYPIIDKEGEEMTDEVAEEVSKFDEGDCNEN